MSVRRHPHCDSFSPKQYPDQTGNCETDGCYLCAGCAHISDFDGMSLYDIRMAFYPDMQKLADFQYRINELFAEAQRSADERSVATEAQ